MKGDVLCIITFVSSRRRREGSTCCVGPESRDVRGTLECVQRPFDTAISECFFGRYRKDVRGIPITYVTSPPPTVGTTSSTGSINGKGRTFEATYCRPPNESPFPADSTELGNAFDGRRPCCRSSHSSGYRWSKLLRSIFRREHEEVRRRRTFPISSNCLNPS